MTLYKVDGQEIWFRPFHDDVQGYWCIVKCNADTGSGSDAIFGQQDSAKFATAQEAYDEAARRAKDYGKRPASDN